MDFPVKTEIRAGAEGIITFSLHTYKEVLLTQGSASVAKSIRTRYTKKAIGLFQGPNKISITNGVFELTTTLTR